MVICRPRQHFTKKIFILNRFPPALAMASIIQSKSLKPYFLVHPNCVEDLGPTATQGETGDYNCVVMGDAVDLFSYRNLNKAFQLIMKTKCPLYALGKGKYYQEDGELTLDVGRYKTITYAHWTLNKIDSPASGRLGQAA